jgi:UDP-N-acetyl-D-mannosaminuronic acid dehydrogenase
MHIPGGGVGGHCLPKDPWLLKHGLDAYGSFEFTPNIIVESRRMNDYMPGHMRDLAVEALGERGVELESARLCILGLAFLEDSDDTRNTPTIPMYDLLRSECEDVVVHDPYVEGFEGVALVKDIEAAVEGRDCVILATHHREYRGLSLDWLKERMRTPVIVDGRNTFDRDACVQAGFSFRGVGIPRK